MPENERPAVTAALAKEQTKEAKETQEVADRGRAGRLLWRTLGARRGPGRPARTSRSVGTTDGQSGFVRRRGRAAGSWKHAAAALREWYEETGRRGGGQTQEAKETQEVADRGRAGRLQWRTRPGGREERAVGVFC